MTYNELIKGDLKSVGEEEEIDKDATLYSLFPENYKKYVIANNVIIVLCCINLSLDFHGQD